MKKMERLLDLYKDLCKIPNISDAWITKTNSRDLIGITSVWSQADLLRNERSKFERNHVIDFNGSTVKPKVLYHSNPVEIKESFRTLSRTGAFSAVLREVIPGKKSSSLKPAEKTEFIDIFSNELSVKENSIDLKSAEKHGKVHTGFGSLKFSYGEGHLLYVAEKFRKPVSFYDTKFDVEKYIANPELDEFHNLESWGEQCSEIKEPVICLLEISTGNINVLDNITADISPCEPIWTPNDDGILFVGVANKPFKLGYSACFNRKSRLYYYNVKNATCSPLTSYDAALKSVRFSDDGSKLVYVESKCGGAHKKSEILKIMDWASKETKTVIDVVQSPGLDDKTFPGLFDANLSARCWSSDNKRLLLTTIWGSKTEIIVVDVGTGQVTCLTNKGNKYGSWRLLDVYQDVLLAVNSSPNRPPVLLVARLPPPGHIEQSDVVWSKLDQEMPRPFSQLVNDIKWDVLTLRRPNAPEEPAEFSDVQYEALLHLPAAKDDEKDAAWPPPLIAMPHGGPHGTSVAAWSPAVAFFVLSGYAVLRINYRGSLGFGQDFVDALPGRVGLTDVLDCKHAVDAALAGLTTVPRDRPPQIFLYGGSHGGFLTGQLIGQFPDYARAAAAINPVLNFASVCFENDIPDWAIVECFNMEFDPTKCLTPEQIAAMLIKSPIHYVEKVKTPLLIAIGENDLRVPNAQIKQYVRILQARNIPVKVLSYPSNDHLLNSVDAEANELINVMMWFENYVTRGEKH